MNLIYIIHNKTLLSGALFSVFSFINQGFGFLLLLILAGYITPSEYGYLSLFNTTLMVLGYFIAMSTQGYFQVAYFKESIQKVKDSFSCILYTCLFVSTFITVLLFVEGTKIAELLDLPLHILYIAVMIAFFHVFMNLNLDYLRVQKKVWKYGAFSCGTALLGFVLSILLVKTFSLGWEGRVWAHFLCTCVIGLYGLIYLSIHGFIVQPSWKHWRKMLLWGIPLIPHLATSFIRQGLDRYIIDGTHSIEDVGYFSFSLTLSTIISMLGFGFNQSNSVDIYTTLGSNETDNKYKKTKIKKQRNFFIILYSVCAFVVFFICYFTIPLLLPKYTESMKYFPILAIYGLLVCLYLVYTNFLFYYNKTKSIMYITFGSAVLHLLLSLLLTRYSLYYTALLYVSTQMLVVFLIRKQALKTIEIELNK